MEKIINPEELELTLGCRQYSLPSSSNFNREEHRRRLQHMAISYNTGVCVSDVTGHQARAVIDMAKKEIMTTSDEIDREDDGLPFPAAAAEVKDRQVVRCLLIEPFPESALNEQAGKMLLEDYDEYAKHARLYTGIHALKPKNKSKTGAISESTTALNVYQSNMVRSENMPMPPTQMSAASVGSKGSGAPTKDENVVAIKIVGTQSAQRKEGDAMVKAQAGKKKMDARKKSLKRL